MEYPSGAGIPMTKDKIKGSRKGRPRKKEGDANYISSQLTAAVKDLV